MAGLYPKLWFLVSFVSVWLGIVEGQSAISLHPGSIPLAVRSPYFHSWLSTLRNATTPPDVGNTWPQLWNGGDHAVGWLGFIRVDGDTYQWLGVGGVEAATTVASYITPTQTIFTYRAGPVDLNITFLSPVEPSDWARQSLPFSYVSIDVVSRDGNNHAVQIYTDLTGEWISPSLQATTRSTTSRTKNIIYHSMQRGDISSMVEESDVALDGTLILATANTNSVTTQTGPSAAIRASFDRSGMLSNEENGTAASITPSYPIIGIAIDLGNVASASSPSSALFALGILRDPVMVYQKEPSNVQDRRPYFFTRWSTIEDALADFLADFPSVLSRSNTLDARIMADARAAGGARLADLVGLSLRQTMASIEITVPQVGDGGLDSRDVKAFMKDIGESRRVTPVNTMYASLPALLYVNASLVGALLDPLLEAQSLSSYPYGFAAPDLGWQYPRAVRNDSDTTNVLAVDSSASMLIMCLAHARKSGEGVLLKRYYELLKKWADFLVDNALRPDQYRSSDGLTQPNNSNLALKGILGIYAMSQINQALEKEGISSELTKQYTDKAKELYGEWENLAFPGRVTSSYSQTGSWTMAYNLFAARLLGVDFIGNQVYEGQTAFHRSQLASNAASYGLGYDSNSEYTVKSHWTLFTAATVTDTSVQEELVANIHNRTFIPGVTPPFATTWDARSGQTLGGRASPAQGAMFAFSAIKLPDVPIQLEVGVAGGGASEGGGNGVGAGNSQDGGSKGKTNVGAIVGGVVGGLAGVLVIVLGVVVWVRRRRGREHRESGDLVDQEKDEAADSDVPKPSAADSRQVAQRGTLFSRIFAWKRDANAAGIADTTGASASEGLAIVPFDATLAQETPSVGTDSGALITSSSIPSSASPSASAAPLNTPQVYTKSSLPIGIGAATVGSPSANSGVESHPSPPGPINGTWSGNGSALEAPSSAYSAPSAVARTRRSSISKIPVPRDDQNSTAQLGVVSLDQDEGRGRAGEEGNGSEALRAEVLALRREMEEMRARTVLNSGIGVDVGGVPDEPPPSYSS